MRSKRVIAACRRNLFSRRKRFSDATIFSGNRRLKLQVLALLALFLTACQSEVTPMPLPTPVTGKATVVGRVVSDETSQPVPRRPVWLAEVLRQEDQAIFVLNTISAPSSLTDQQGRFIIANVDPKEYVIVVGDPYSNDYDIITESPDNARIWKLEANKTLDVGKLRVWFKP